MGRTICTIFGDDWLLRDTDWHPQKGGWYSEVIHQNTRPFICLCSFKLPKYGCVVNNKQQNPVKWFVITCSWNTYFKFLFSWCLFDFCPCKDTGRKHEEQWKIWHVTSRSPAGHFVQCALTWATHLTLALCFLCVTILLSAVRFLYLMSFSAVLCLYLSSSWPCPAPCPSIWMYTTSVNLHLDFSSSPCTGHAQSQPSQLSGERVFTQAVVFENTTRWLLINIFPLFSVRRQTQVWCEPVGTSCSLWVLLSALMWWTCRPSLPPSSTTFKAASRMVWTTDLAIFHSRTHTHINRSKEMWFFFFFPFFFVINKHRP